MRAKLRFHIATAVAVVALLGANMALAQRNPQSGTNLRSLAEVTLLKKKADAGDIDAQLKLGHTFASRACPASSLVWYRKAAAQGSVQAAALAGELLVFGRSSLKESQSVAPKPDDGLALIYFAATNKYATAWRNMSLALQRGLGTRTNLAEAYAWLRFYTELDTIRRKQELDALGLQLTVPQLDLANRMVLDLHRGKWPPLKITPDYKSDSRLTLSGIAIGGRCPLAIINRKTIAEGESAAVPVASGTINIKCLKVMENAVIVAVDQELEPRLISLY